jgi:hypothetical protein
MNRPLLIVLTPVRNEAWILPAFLKATSLWADYIIIADQMSTDGSRDIYTQYEKVILVDNPRTEMHQARTRQLLFDAAKKIEGDKILFTLDADEFLSGDFVNTKGWQTIMNSEPGDVFCFRWMNLLPGMNTYLTHVPYYWAANVNDDVMNGFFPDNHIHEWRLPWPNNVNKEYIIEDISFIHFARVNVKRQQNKEKFYQVSTAYNDKSYSGIKLFRHYQTYHPINKDDIFILPPDTYVYYEKMGVDILSNIDNEDYGKYYIQEIQKYFDLKGVQYFAKLDIWDDDFIKDCQLKNPQKIYHKLITQYLRYTKKHAKSLVVKGIDYVLKKMY